MASAFPQMSGDARRHFSSSGGGGGGANRYENNRPPVNRQTPCKNGPLCRKFQEGTCPFNHDFSSMPANGLSAPKRSLNVESPSFTPKTAHAQPAGVQSPRSMGISPKSAAAAAFTPRGSGSVTPSGTSHSKVPSNEFVPQNFQPSANFQEFVPQNFVQSQQLDQQTQLSNQINAFADPFLASHALQSLDGSHQTINPYADHTPAAAGQAFFQDATAFKHPLNYHLYASLGPRRELMTPYQRTTSDFFLPDDLREDLQRKSEATLQTFPNSTLPQNVDNHFHSLVALDSVSQRSTSVFGYPTWIYKATSSIDGNVYALRRIEGFRLTSDSAINTKQAWKKLASANVVRAHDAFTTSAFGDRSLILVQDYHPLSQTLAAKHFGRPSQPTPLSEEALWSYTVQLANALKAIHSAGLAARTLVPSKVLLTDTNRLRLSGCAVLDIVQFETTSSQPLADQHATDLRDLGRLLLGLATRNHTAHANVPKALELVSRSYTERFRGCLQWLLSPPAPLAESDSETATAGASDYNIHTLVTNLSDQILSTFDASLTRSDVLTSNLASELENGRLVRLLTKLLTILERPPSEPATSSNPSQPSAAWSETGERYHLRLFRDYVFHRVDADGRAVLDLGHVLACLNKLDAGSEERVQLISPDGQSVFVVTYREVKRGVESVWGELSRGGRR